MITPVLDTQKQYQGIVPVMAGGQTPPPPLSAVSTPAPAQAPAVPAQTPPATPTKDVALTDNLSSFVRGHWERAKQERISSGIEERMIRAKQARALEYDATKRAEIAVLHGKDWEPPYMPVIESKCRAAEDWIMDVYFQPGTRPFGIENTPDPDVPKEVEELVNSMFKTQAAEAVVQKYVQANMPLDPTAMDIEIQDLLKQQADAIHRQIKQVAKDLTEKFEIRIDDKLSEGGWYQALREVVRDIVTFPAAFIKGPEERMIIKRSRTFSPKTGRYIVTYEHKASEQFGRVSPINIYPLVGARTCQDGLIERTQYSPMDLQDMLDVDGFDGAEIRAVLTEAGNGALREWTSIDSRVALLDNKSTNTMYMGDNVDALIFNGQAPGKLLIEWGMNKSRKIITDTEKWYRVYCILIGRHVVMARLNPNPDGKINYYKASFIEDADKFWGQAIPDILWGHQVTANAVFRACGINAAMASGPVIEQDSERCKDMGPIHPFKRFLATPDQMKSGSPAIRLYNIQLVALQLSKFYEFLMDLCDFDSGVPKFSHGGEASQGINTASGQAMQLSQSSRGIKAVIEHMDRGLTAPSVEAEAYYIIDHDESAKPPAGDMKIIAKGSASLIVKELATIRLREFLGQTNNPVDLQLVGLPGRRELLREVMKSLPIDRDKVLPEEQAIIDQMTGVGAGGEIQPEGGAPVEALAPSGEPTGGRDFKTMEAMA